MDGSQTQVPQSTVWPVNVRHGLVETAHGPAHGWGWMCYAHDEPYTKHGYESAEAMLEDLRHHLRRCVGNG